MIDMADMGSAEHNLLQHQSGLRQPCFGKDGIQQQIISSRVSVISLWCRYLCVIYLHCVRVCVYRYQGCSGG